LKSLTKNRIIRYTFIIYSAVMLWLLFGRNQHTGEVGYWELLKININIIPFETIGRYIRALMNGKYIKTALINLIGNIAVFIPLGYYLPHIFRRVRHFGLFLLFHTEIIVFIELIQLFTLLGVCDVDDLILNTLGGIIGYSLYLLNSKISLTKR